MKDDQPPGEIAAFRAPWSLLVRGRLSPRSDNRGGSFSVGGVLYCYLEISGIFGSLK